LLLLVTLVQSRPFGVALLIAGIDETGPVLFHTDPSGTFVQFEAKAIGAGSEGAQTALQEKYNKVTSQVKISSYSTLVNDIERS
jgi:20S proteasome subunit alpha 5